MRSARRWWIIYVAGVAVVLLAVLWTSSLALRLEVSEHRARAEVDHQEALRSALWRMDSFLAPLLAREAARPPVEYQAFTAPAEAYTKLLSQIEPGEVLTPSPLLSFQSEYFALHFQRDPQGQITSPQAPVGNLRDLAEGSYLPTSRIEANDLVLSSVKGLLSIKTDLVACVDTASVEAVTPLPPPETSWQAGEGGQVAAAPIELAQQLRNAQEYASRKDSYLVQQTAANPLPDLASGEACTFPNEAPPVPVMAVGPLVPLWMTPPGTGDRELLFLRNVRHGEREVVQGFLCDWPTLRGELLVRVTDLFPEAALVPIEPAAAPDPAADPKANLLATIPVALLVGEPVAVPLATMSPARSTLLMTWIIVLVGVVAVAMTLRAAIEYGRKRSRFASAVTHELRTPLTTFQMYTDMLAEGMVTDEAKRRDYLGTLRSESARLSALVENVLAYARLEDGRRPASTEQTTVGALLERIAPPLRRRAEAGEMDLQIRCDTPEETPLRTDVDAVGQILFNLVDNACKYGPTQAARRVEIGVARQNGRLHVDVRDQGPGVARAHADSIFDPFERGENNHGTTPGIGLGLALSRELARDLRGDLELLEGPGGACFRLTLPA